jgi:glycosyltransferase involved in cell wall biosynthesis
MHIIFLSHNFPPEVNALATRTFEHCKYWVKNGHKVTVLTCFPNFPEGRVYKGYKRKLFQWEEAEGIRILRVWTYVAPNQGILKRTLSYFSYVISSLLGVVLIKKGDLVISSTPQFFSAVAGYFFSRLSRLPHFLEVRDLWPESIVAVGALKNRNAIRILEWLESFMYLSSKKIIVVTDSFKRELLKKGVPADKIEVVKNGVDLDFFRPDIDAAKQKEELGLKGKFLVSYIGTIGMAHALMQVLELAELTRDNREIVFLLVGTGAEKGALMEAKRKRRLENVIFADKQSKDNIVNFYAMSDVCLVTLKNAPLFKTVIPSKVFEIMAMGKPVLLGVDGEVRELVAGRARAGIYFRPEDIRDFHEKLMLLFNDPVLRSDLGASGRGFVEKEFNRNKMAEKFINMLKEHEK